ncbi:MULTISPECIES: TetR/AcrR family transcriptional regulator [Pseudovibrio]|uniref:TetR/AcrR family transcriptional regulator n=1 Tax=Stappiaceae TaxID=2821832 RepID=UPI0023671E7E|nr:MULTISPECIES: TetR/AcrR family transcriptional regulator [Pseudovibrio]MDD7912086.1 TetR/AcrR family transcriptional regulator [Pseudovibrio exalbescens]MDX5592436.1 TetR/AcrR family transcriptional regulator [Pseudovibrio sp. SPO723]
MGRPPRTQNTRRMILDAAIELVSEQGNGVFSLEEVAKRAGISKGGLLYNFPSKNALIAAMVSHFTEELKQRVSEAEQVVAKDQLPNKLIRAHLMGLKAKLSKGHKPNFGILAAIGEDPSMLDPVRQYNRDLYERILKDSDNPELAALVFFSTEGIRCMQIFNIIEFDTAEILEHLDTLLTILEVNELPEKPL